jgi:hypothetical protein
MTIDDHNINKREAEVIFHPTKSKKKKKGCKIVRPIHGRRQGGARCPLWIFGKKSNFNKGTYITY